MCVCVVLAIVVGHHGVVSRVHEQGQHLVRGCAYVCTCVCVHVRRWAGVHGAHVYVYAGVYVSVHVSVWACESVCTRICVCVCVCVCVCA